MWQGLLGMFAQIFSDKLTPTFCLKLIVLPEVMGLPVSQVPWEPVGGLNG